MNERLMTKAREIWLSDTAPLCRKFELSKSFTESSHIAFHTISDREEVGSGRASVSWEE